MKIINNWLQKLIFHVSNLINYINLLKILTKRIINKIKQKSLLKSKKHKIFIKQKNYLIKWLKNCTRLVAHRSDDILVI